MTKLIIGLGNIGAEYEKTRHNVGFMAVDAFAAKNGLTWLEKAKFKAFMAELSVGGEKVILAKPTTFMNLSGESARAIKDFYKINNDDVLVVHDELALPFGTIRTRVGGSDAGNNGIKSVSAHIGHDYHRMRVGIANDILAKQGAHDFVLSRFTKEEQESLESTLQKTIGEQMSTFIDGDFTHTTHR